MTTPRGGRPTAAKTRGGDQRGRPKAKAEDGGLVSRIGPLEIDWPRSFGYFGGIGLAVGIGIIDPPLGVFIAAIPFLKMLDLGGAPKPSRFLGQIVEGVAKPVGGDSQGTVRMVSSKGADGPPVD